MTINLMFLLIMMSGLYMFFMNNKYFLINLLCIEFIMLGLFNLIYLYLMMFNYEIFFSMIFISFMVCEGVLGLSLLIIMIRSMGNSLIKTMKLFLW